MLPYPLKTQDRHHGGVAHELAWLDLIGRGDLRDAEGPGGEDGGSDNRNVFYFTVFR